MSCFELVCNVLDELWEAIPGATDAEKAEQVKPKLNVLSQQYANLGDATPIDYSDPCTQFAYIFKYTATHGNFVYMLLGEAKKFLPLPGQTDFRLTSLGGGPGSDLIGCLKFFDKLGAPNMKFSTHNLDKEDDWRLCWSKIVKTCSNTACADKLHGNFHTIDVTTSSTCTPNKNYMNANVFSMVYFLSEAIKAKDKSKEFLESFFQAIPEGAFVVFLDNNMPDVYGWFDELVKNDFESLITGEQEWMPDIDEQKSKLKKYIDLFAHNPKINANLAFRVVRKRQSEDDGKQQSKITNAQKTALTAHSLNADLPA